jgi:anti-anti-sigma regulatory factor
MAVRIFSASEATATVVRIAGKLRAEDLGELERETREAAGSLILEISELTFVDTEGARTLKALVRQGAEIRGMSPYLGLLLGRSGSSV